jgi:hypothetical protein
MNTKYAKISPSGHEKTMQEIDEVLSELRHVLETKNLNYGDSLQNPIQTFHRGSVVDGICARMDDKLGRIRRVGLSDQTEDTLMDLIGYAVHLVVATRRANGSASGI